MTSKDRIIIAFHILTTVFCCWIVYKMTIVTLDSWCLLHA